MDAKLEGPAVTASQEPAQSAAAMYLRNLGTEYWDSGIDSDEPSPFRPDPEVVRWSFTLHLDGEDSSDEDFLDNMIRDKKNTEAEPLKDMGDAGQLDRDQLDIDIQWRQNRDIRESSLSETSADRSSPPLYEVELTASDEDDDASVLELVIPMQSRYQRVPTSSPKKPKPKNPTLFSSLFCCIRK